MQYTDVIYYINEIRKLNAYMEKVSNETKLRRINNIKLSLLFIPSIIMLIIIFIAIVKFSGNFEEVVISCSMGIIGILMNLAFGISYLLDIDKDNMF